VPTPPSRIIWSRRVARGADARGLGHHLIRRLAQVGQAVRVAGRQRQHHAVRAAGDGRFGAAQVGHQHRDVQPRQGFRKGHQLGGVGQLRQQARRHEGADLDLAQACRVGGANPFHLLRGGQRAGDALQAVAQADLANHGPARQRGHGVQGLSPDLLVGAQFRVS
jgi:hypothetical protein